MPSEISKALKSYNAARGVLYYPQTEAILEREYQDSIAGGVIPWFLGLDKHEKWTARWLSENGFATIILKSPDCGCDGSCCSTGLISAGSDKPILKLPTKLELTDEEFAEVRREQRKIVHPILTDELLRVLELYLGLLEEAGGKVHYTVLEKAKSVRDLCLGKWVSVSAFQIPSDQIESGIVAKIKNCLEDYGWRLEEWNVIPSRKVLSATDRLCAKVYEDGILFEVLFEAVDGIEQHPDTPLERLTGGGHRAIVARVARMVQAGEVRKYELVRRV